VHTLVEKPFSTDAISGKELVRAADECDAKLLVGHHRRFVSQLFSPERAREATY
jgi:predicted dehydrogenase